MAGPPPPPYTASWRIDGLINDRQKWSIGWHLSLANAVAITASTVLELHQALLLISELATPSLMSDPTVPSLSRLLVTGPVSSVSSDLYLTSQGARGTPVPSAIAVCVRQVVQARGKGRNGRFFLPAPAEEDCQFGFQLTPAAVTSISSTLAAMFDEINAITTGAFPFVRFCILHRREHGQWLPQAEPLLVDTWLLRSRLSTQDRRMTTSTPN